MNWLISATLAAMFGLLAVGPCVGCNTGHMPDTARRAVSVSMRLKILPGENVVMLADRDNDGKLSMKEVTDFLAGFGIITSQHEVARFDLNQDGFLDVAELDEALLNVGRNIIKIMDEDGDGKLSLKEIEARLHLPNTDFLQQIDIDGDGYLSVEEIESIPEELLVLLKRVPATRVEQVVHRATTKMTREGYLPTDQQEHVELTKESDESSKKTRFIGFGSAVNENDDQKQWGIMKSVEAIKSNTFKFWEITKSAIDLVVRLLAVMLGLE